VWVPPGIRDRFDRRPPRPPPIEPVADDDGTVSSKAQPRSRKPAEEPGARFAERAPAPPRKGGIQFTRDDDDDDLASYMHPDDVPPKPEKP
jgi:hypothetical protein